MTREEQKKKIYYVQMSKDFFESKNIQQLLATSAGDTIFRIYLQLWCKSLATGGTLQLEGDVPMAEELAIILGLLPLKKVALDRWQAELKIIESAVEICEKYRLIEVTECGIEFLMTGEYTRAWTKEAIEKRANRQAETNEAAEATAPIETTQEQPEETEEEQKKREKKEAAKQKKAEEKARINAFMEKLWKAYIPGHGRGKSAVKDPRKKELYEIGEERCMKALEAYKRSDVVKRGFIQNAGNFFNEGIDDYLDMSETTQQTIQTQAPTVPIQERLIRDGLYTTAGTLTADAAEKWPAVKDHYTEEERKRIEKKLNI